MWAAIRLSYREQIARKQRTQSSNSKFSGGEFFMAEETSVTPLVTALYAADVTENREIYISHVYSTPRDDPVIISQTK